MDGRYLKPRSLLKAVFGEEHVVGKLAKLSPSPSSQFDLSENCRHQPGIVTFGSLSGSMLPFILKRLGFDPASASAPFVATLVDVTGLVIYFSIAAMILHGYWRSGAAWRTRIALALKGLEYDQQGVDRGDEIVARGADAGRGDNADEAFFLLAGAAFLRVAQAAVDFGGAVESVGRVCQLARAFEAGVHRARRAACLMKGADPCRTFRPGLNPRDGHGGGGTGAAHSGKASAL